MLLYHAVSIHEPIMLLIIGSYTQLDNKQVLALIDEVWPGYIGSFSTTYLMNCSYITAFPFLFLSDLMCASTVANIISHTQFHFQ